MKRNGYYWFNQLDKETQKRFSNNITCDWDWYMDLGRECYGSMWDFISGAFAWRDSPEGHEYWAGIAKGGVIGPKYNMKNFTM